MNEEIMLGEEMFRIIFYFLRLPQEGAAKKFKEILKENRKLAVNVLERIPLEKRVEALKVLSPYFEQSFHLTMQITIRARLEIEEKEELDNLMLVYQSPSVSPTIAF